MAQTLDGTFTIKQVLAFTKQKFKTRFKYTKRDRIKMIRIKTIRFYNADRTKAPTIKYEIVSQSTPNYSPYLRDKRGRKHKYQRTIHHEYDTIFQFGSEGITVNTKQWKSVTGSMRKIPKKIPQDKVGTVFRETSKRWKKLYSAEEYKRKIRSHKKRAKYVSTGDYIAQVYGINLDFIYRQAYVYKKFGHLYGRNYNPQGNQPPKITNPQQVMFFNKHQIAIIKILLSRGILTK